MANQNEIVLRIQDETEDGRFSVGVDVENDAVKAATKTATEVTKAQKSTAQKVGTALAKNVANTATGGAFNQAMALAVATPMAIAMLAYHTAMKVYNEWKNYHRQVQEQVTLRVRAGGDYRGAVNQYNLRTNLITGRANPERNIYGRR